MRPIMLAGCICVLAGRAASGQSCVYVPDFSTYLGAPGSPREVIARPNGNILVHGHIFITNPSFYPRVERHGPLGGGSDAYVAEFDAATMQPLWIALIGGNGVDRGYGMRLHTDGSIYIAGQTSSADFPTTPGAMDRTKGPGGSCLGTHGCALDAYVAHLSSDGRTLLHSTYVGGSGSDGARGGLSIDSQGNSYVAGFTESTDLPAKVNNYTGGASDAFITKLSPDLSKALWTRYLGASMDSVTSGEVILGSTVDSSGQLHAHGIVRGTDMQTTSNAFQRTFGGGASDVFYVKLDAQSGALVYSTYYGGSLAEFSEHGQAMDAGGNFFFGGTTESVNFPVVSATQPNFAGVADTFVVKMSPIGQPVFSTFLGGAVGSESTFGPALDSSGNVFLHGATDSTDFPVTPGAYDRTENGGEDAYLAQLSPGGVLQYATYIGGSAMDHGRYVAVDPLNRPLITGEVTSANYPVTNGTTLHSSGSDGFLTRFVCAGSAPRAPTNVRIQ